jgi:(p)ppGpp synthase/HD superfamily hydrolase
LGTDDRITVQPPSAVNASSTASVRFTRPSIASLDNELLLRAFTYAATQFHGDTRKETSVPYISHLMSVAALVMEAEGTDVQVAAALLHDSAEDKGGEAELARIESEFGPDVAAIVRDLSDSLVDTTVEGAVKAPWRLRKEAYIEHLAGADTSSLLVSAADKLHNARCILADYRKERVDLWERFNESDPDQQLWYYRSLADTFCRRLPNCPLSNELKRTVDELERLVRATQPAGGDRAASSDR